MRPTLPRFMPRRSIRSTFFAAIVLAGVVATGRGQGISRSVDRAQLLRNQQPTLREESGTNSETEGVAPASPNDPDLGEQAILKRTDQYQPWSIVVSAPISYTSNVALVPTGEKSDTLFTPLFAVSYSPRFTQALYGNFSVSQQMFYYDRFTALNFGSFDAHAGVSYSIPQWHDLIFRGGYSYNRLTDTDFDEFFSSHSLVGGAELPFRIGRAQQISVGVDTSINLDSEPAPPGRNEYSAFFGYTAQVARNLTFNAVVRLAVRDYTDLDRTDVSEILAVSATYYLRPWLSLNVAATYAHNDSNRDVFDYDVGNGGGALSVNFRF